MGQKTSKLMTIHKALHPRDDLGILFVSRKERGRWLISTEDCVDALIQVKDNIKKSKERLIIAVSNMKDKQKSNKN